MRKILFTKNILGHDRELFDFLSRRFDVLVATIPGSQAYNVGKILEWTHQANSKLYVRSQFIHTTPLEMIVEKAMLMKEGGVDGLVFQGQTVEEKVNELMLAFQDIARELSSQNVKLPVVFMVDSQAGQIDLFARLKKLVGVDGFPWNLDVRTAVRIASQSVTPTTKFPAADLIIIDFSPFDTGEQYANVDKIVMGSNLEVIAYMTYDIMSSDLKQAIQQGYGIPARENGKKSVTAQHDLTLRNKPSGQIIKRADGKPLVVKAGMEAVLLGVEKKGTDTWYQVETVFGISGWIAGEIGGKIYAA